MAFGLSGKVLPAHPKPYFDEMLSSWIQRLAAANGMKAHTFVSSVFPGVQVWTRDIDLTAPEVLLTRLADLAHVDVAIVRSMVLRSFEGLLFESLTVNPPWVRTAGILHRRRTRFGIQVCVRCLSEEPYYRLRWRLETAASI